MAATNGHMGSLKGAMSLIVLPSSWQLLPVTMILFMTKIRSSIKNLVINMSFQR